MRIVGRYIVNLLLAVDQLVSTVLGGHPDETLSSRLGRSMGHEKHFFVKPLRLLVDYVLFFWDYELDEESGKKIRHCEKSVMPLEQSHLRNLNYEIWSWGRRT